MKLINQFVYDEQKYFLDLLKKENVSNPEKVLKELNFSNDIIEVNYLKDEKGSFYKHVFLNGNKINWNDLNGYQKGVVYNFENETNIMFQ